MSLRRWWYPVVGLLAWTGCQVELAGEEKQEKVQSIAEEPRIHLLVKFNGHQSPCLSESEEKSRCSDEGVLFDRVRKLSVPISEARTMLDSLEASDDVEWAEIDQELEQAQFGPSPNLIPNDPFFPHQSHHQVIQTPRAWREFSQSSPNVKVVVCDSGVSTGHEDLVNNVRSTSCINLVNQYLGDCRIISGHGTEVAGIIAAQGNNQLGVTGMTWQSQIIPVQVVSHVKDGVAITKASHLAACIRHAAQIDADVVNISFETMDDSGKVPQVIVEAANFALIEGVLTVAAGGNKIAVQAKDVGSILHVGATSANGRGSLNDFGGMHLDLSAPGENVLTTSTSLDCNDLNRNGQIDLEECGSYSDGYRFVEASGSSYSAPMVSGAVALLKSIRPSLHPLEAQCVLQKSSLDLGEFGRDRTFGEGLLQVDAAARMVRDMDAVFKPHFSLGRMTNFTFPMTRKVTLSAVYANGYDVLGRSFDLSSRVQWFLPDGTVAVGSPATAQFTKPGTYRVMAAVIDDYCNAKSDWIDVTVTNSAPSVTMVSPRSASLDIKPGQAFSLTAFASDLEEGDISDKIEWSLYRADKSVTSLGTGATLFHTFASEGVYLIYARTTDSEGLTHVVQVVVTVRNQFNAPAAPTELTLSNPARFVALLRWKDNAIGELGYHIERAEVLPSTSTLEYDDIGAVGPNVTYFRDIVRSGTYSYRVRAFNQTGDSATIEGKIIVR